MDSEKDRHFETVSLKEYIEKLFMAHEESSREAGKLYREEIERRLESLNELRSQVTQDREQFIKREVFEVSIRGIEDRRDKMDIRLSGLDRRLTAAETRIITWTSALVMFLIVIQIVLKIILK